MKISNIILNESKYATINSFEERITPLEYMVKDIFEVEKLICKWVALNEKRHKKEKWVKTWE